MSTIPTTLKDNLTLSILSKAEAGGYGILSQSCYDAQSAIALVRAAERLRSPAILQLFPITLMYGGGPFLQFCLTVSHSASVPIAVHLDHATDEEHLELAIGLAEKGIKFDSIMVDASHAETDEENIAIAKPWVERAIKAGVAVEVELGRLEGGEAGLRMIEGAKMTEPGKAEEFMEGTGALILAPSIGNLHGSYIQSGGPKFNQDILKALHDKFKGRIPLCLHGTDELPDELFKECIKNGVSKLNVNSWARDPYIASLSSSLSPPSPMPPTQNHISPNYPYHSKKPFPDAIEEATEVFAGVCERMMKVFGSVGKADE
ncbi:aldolase [Dendrothele bispora CBS 962.96]|uniref:Fructose-bisphosphate aldolase n=1 Tax=Dendrothele bispora (strain CBS 962.96) TaxID=1314807 RepID=A0A4S8KXY4_DENBC|nr:aldolase [Dendrothele bispora CBS 962.96]